LLQNTALFLYQKELKIWNECFPKTKRVLDGGARVLTPYWAQNFTLYILYWMIFIKVFQLNHSKYIQWFPYMIFIKVFPTSKYIQWFTYSLNPQARFILNNLWFN
jgi:hypothetical protein